MKSCHGMGGMWSVGLYRGWEGPQVAGLGMTPISSFNVSGGCRRFLS